MKGKPTMWQAPQRLPESMPPQRQQPIKYDLPHQLVSSNSSSTTYCTSATTNHPGFHSPANAACAYFIPVVQTLPRTTTLHIRCSRKTPPLSSLLSPSETHFDEFPIPGIYYGVFLVRTYVLSNMLAASTGRLNQELVNGLLSVRAVSAPSPKTISVVS